MLTQAQLKARDGKFTGTCANIVMSGDEAEILSLWNQMLGLEGPPDLSGVWPVRLGEATEALNLEWYVRKYGPVSRVGEVVIGDPQWMAATLDGYDETNHRVVECKHVGGREPLETIVARYQPQMHWQMMVAVCEECALSVIMGANEPIVEIVPFVPEYGMELFSRASAFMLCVQTLTPPVAVPAVEPPVIPAKEYDFNGNPDWQLLALRWTQSYGAAQIAKECEASIKKLVPQDAKKAFGAGIVVTRNRAGSMSLRELR